MHINSFVPFKNEATSIEAYGVTVENRLDRVIIYGDVEYWTSDDSGIEFTKDKEGLSRVGFIQALLALKMKSLTPEDNSKAVFLKGILDSVAEALKSIKALPEKITIEKPVFKENPFA
jgi:hypothetical protein